MAFGKLLDNYNAQKSAGGGNNNATSAKNTNSGKNQSANKNISGSFSKGGSGKGTPSGKAVPTGTKFGPSLKTPPTGTHPIYKDTSVAQNQYEAEGSKGWQPPSSKGPITLDEAQKEALRQGGRPDERTTPLRDQKVGQSYLQRTTEEAERQKNNQTGYDLHKYNAVSHYLHTGEWRDDHIELSDDVIQGEAALRAAWNRGERKGFQIVNGKMELTDADNDSPGWYRSKSGEYDAQAMEMNRANEAQFWNNLIETVNSEDFDPMNTVWLRDQIRHINAFLPNETDKEWIARLQLAKDVLTEYQNNQYEASRYSTIFTQLQNDDYSTTSIDNALATLQTLRAAYNGSNLHIDYDGTIAELEGLRIQAAAKDLYDLQQQISQAEVEKQQAEQALAALTIATSSYISYGSTKASRDEAAEKVDAADAKITELTAKKAELEASYVAAYATPEVLAAIERLKSGGVLGVARQNTYMPIVRERNKNAKGPEDIVTVDQLVAEDQALVDAFYNNDLGVTSQYFTGRDRFAAWNQSVQEGIIGSLADAGYALSQMYSDFNASATNMIQDSNAYAVDLGLDHRVTQREKEAYQAEAMKAEMYDALNGDGAYERDYGGTVLSQHDHTERIKEIDAQLATNEAEHDKIMATGGMGYDPGEFSRLLADNVEEKRRLTKEQKELEKDQYEYGVEERPFEKLLRETGDRSDVDSQRLFAQALNGAGPGAQFAMKVGKTAAEVGFDTVVSLTTHVPALVPMAVRVFGQESAAARRDGASFDESILFGAAKTGIEVFTEKMFGMKGFTYGKGFLSGLADNMVSDLGTSTWGMIILSFLSHVNEEGMEEVVSDLLAPLADMIYRDEDFETLFRQETANILESYFLGAILGLAGTVTSFGTVLNDVADVYKQDAKAFSREGEAETGSRLNALVGEDVVDAALTPREQNQLSNAKRREAYQKTLQDKIVEAETGVKNRRGKGGNSTGSDANDVNLITRTEARTKDRIEQMLDRAGDVGVGVIEHRSGVSDTEAKQGLKPQEPGGAPISSATNAKEYEARVKADAGEVVNKIRDAVQNKTLSAERVSEVSWSDFAKIKPGAKLTEKVGEFFRSLGNKVASKALGGKDVIIDERSIKDDIAHGVGRAKACTFKAVPDVLANGTIVDEQTNWKGRGYDTKVIAGAISIDGKPAYVGCVVRSINDGNGQRFYLHEVVDGKGNLIYSFDGMPAEIESGPDAAIKTGMDTGTAPEPVTSVPQTTETGNTQNTSNRGTVRDNYKHYQSVVDDLADDVRSEPNVPIHEKPYHNWTIGVHRRSDGTLSAYVRYEGAATDGRNFYGNTYIGENYTSPQDAAAAALEYAYQHEADEEWAYYTNGKERVAPAQNNAQNASESTQDAEGAETSPEDQAAVKPGKTEVKPSGNSIETIDDLVSAIVGGSISKDQARAVSVELEGQEWVDKEFDKFWNFYANIDRDAGNMTVKEDEPLPPQPQSDKIEEEPTGAAIDLQNAIDDGVIIENEGGAEDGTPRENDTGIFEDAQIVNEGGQASKDRDRSNDTAPSQAAASFINENDKALRAEHAKVVATYEKEGGRVVSREEWTQEEADAEVFLHKLGIAGLTIIDMQGNAPSRYGSNRSQAPGIGVFVVRRNTGDQKADRVAFRKTVIHEALHNKLSQLKGSAKAAYIIELGDSLINSRHFQENAYRNTIQAFMCLYASHYAGANPNFFKLRPELQNLWFSRQPIKKLGNLMLRSEQEAFCYLFAGQHEELFEADDFDATVNYFRDKVAGRLFTRVTGAEIADFVNAEYDDVIQTDYSLSTREQTLQRENEDLRRQLEELKAQQAEQDQQAEQEETTQVQEEPHLDQSNIPGTKADHKTSFEDQMYDRGARIEHETRKQEIAEKFGTDDGTFFSKTREKVSRMARWCISHYGLQNEYDRLMNKRDWDRLDYSIAGKIIYEMNHKLHLDMSSSRGLGPVLEMRADESFEEYNRRQAESDKKAYRARRQEIDALMQLYNENKSQVAQELQEKYKFSVADEIRMRASQRFLGYTIDGEVGSAEFPTRINVRMWKVVDDLLNEVETLESKVSEGYTPEDVQDLINTVKRINYIRGRHNLFGKLGVKGETRLFAKMVKNGVEPEALVKLAYGSVGRIMDDLITMSWADAAHTIRVSNMLSNIATAVNNFANNAVSARTGALAQNIAVLPAKAFEKLTGKKVAFVDTGLFRTKPIRRAEALAFEYSLLSSYYGLMVDEGRLDTKGHTGGFDVNGSMVERLLARYNFFVSAAALNPDAPAKARARAGMQAGIDKAFAGMTMENPENFQNKKELEGFAVQESKRRTLQDDNALTNFILYGKNRLNKIQTPGGKKVVGTRELGSLKLGDFLMAFAKVPANVVQQKIAATPYGALYHVGRYAMGIAQAKADPNSMTSAQMAKLSRDVGRAATTAGMIVIGALAAACGALKNFDNGDDEEKKLAAEKGYRGLMFNVDALFRPGDDWQEGDHIISGGFLEVLAMPLAIGGLIWDDYVDNDKQNLMGSIWNGTTQSFTQILDSIGDIPGLQQAGELYQSFMYADPSGDDGAWMKTKKAIGLFAASSSTSYYMPNLFSQAAAGFSNTVKDVYRTDSYGQTLLYTMLNKIPGARKLIPEKTDAFGNVRRYGSNRATAMLNTVVLPGDVHVYHQNEVEQEFSRLRKAGYDGTWFDTSEPKSFTTDGQQFTLTADQSRTYHDTKAGHLMEAYQTFINSDEYKNLSDAERVAVFSDLRLDADRQTKKETLEVIDPSASVKMDSWETTLTTMEDRIEYLSAKAQFDTVWDNEEGVTDYAAMDNLIRTVYPKLSDVQKELLNGSNPYADQMYSASRKHIDSKRWQIMHDVYSEYNETDEEGKKIHSADLASESAMWAEMAHKTGYAENGVEMKWARDELKLYYVGSPNTENYDALVDNDGWTLDDAHKLMADLDALVPTKGRKAVSPKQRYTAIAKQDVPDDQKYKAFFDMVSSNSTNIKAKMKKYQDQGIDYASALKAAKQWDD